MFIVNDDGVLYSVCNGGSPARLDGITSHRGVCRPFRQKFNKCKGMSPFFETTKEIKIVEFPNDFTGIVFGVEGFYFRRKIRLSQTNASFLSSRF